MGMIISREYTVDELREQASEALGITPGITLRLAPGIKIVIPHPLFVDDSVLEALNEMGDAADPIAIAKALLGEDHKILREHGGRSSDVVAAWTLMQRQMQDTMPGSGDPTRSATSSAPTPKR
jgi:hypothetical protein